MQKEHNRSCSENPGGIEVGTARASPRQVDEAEHSLHFGLLALSKGVRAICIVHVVLDHVWQIRGFIAAAVGAGVTAVVRTQRKRRIANNLSPLALEQDGVRWTRENGWCRLR